MLSLSSSLQLMLWHSSKLRHTRANLNHTEGSTCCRPLSAQPAAVGKLNGIGDKMAAKLAQVGPFYTCSLVATRRGFYRLNALNLQWRVVCSAYWLVRWWPCQQRL